MRVRLKQEVLRNLLIDIKTTGFTSDGCECGDYGYKLDDHLYIVAYRSCHKITEHHDRWEIRHIGFYPEAKFYSNCVEVEEDDRLNVKLESIQMRMIEDRLRRVTILNTGSTEDKYIGWYRYWRKDKGRFE